MSDHALVSGDIESLINKFGEHIEDVVREKYYETAALMKIKEESTENGRKYVEAYVEYTHTLEAIHDILEHGNVPHAGH